MRYLILFSILLSSSFVLHAQDAGKEEEPLGLPEIMAGYFEAQGGLEYIETINSLRMHGTLEQDGMSIPFVQVKKRPNLLRMTVTYENKNNPDVPAIEMIMGYNGEVAWQTIRQREQAIELTGKDRANFIREATLFSHLYQPDDPNVTITYLGEDKVNGHDVYRLKVVLKDGYEVIYCVDQETFHDVQVETTAEHDGKTVKMVSVFEDYQQMENLQLPFHITSYEEGEVVYVIELEKVGLNPGIYDAYFDPPGGIEGKDPLPEKKPSNMAVGSAN